MSRSTTYDLLLKQRKLLYDRTHKLRGYHNTFLCVPSGTLNIPDEHRHRFSNMVLYFTIAYAEAVQNNRQIKANRLWLYLEDNEQATRDLAGFNAPVEYLLGRNELLKEEHEAALQEVRIVINNITNTRQYVQRLYKEIEEYDYALKSMNPHYQPYKSMVESQLYPI